MARENKIVKSQGSMLTQCLYLDIFKAHFQQSEFYNPKPHWSTTDCMKVSESSIAFDFDNIVVEDFIEEVIDESPKTICGNIIFQERKEFASKKNPGKCLC